MKSGLANWLIWYIRNMSMRRFLALGMMAAGTFSSPASASSVKEVRDLHHEVRLDMGIIFMYNMSIWGRSWGSGCV